MEPLVDVTIAVYNHAPYLKQALDSVLSQKTNFPIRIIIGDDHSTDGSAEMIRDYETRFPDKILAIYQEKNLGLDGTERNGIIILNKATAKYIAILDGDDYWTDPLKLQKQVDFLEKNPDFAFCYHHVKVSQENDFTSQKREMRTNQPEISTIKEVLQKSIWPHINSILYRREEMPECPDWLSQCLSADWAILAIITGNKKIKYMNESMSVYRQHGSGTWSSKTIAQRAYGTLKTAKILKRYQLKGKNDIYIYWPIHYAYRDIIDSYKTNQPLKALYFSLLSRLLDIKQTFLQLRENIKAFSVKK